MSFGGGSPSPRQPCQPAGSTCRAVSDFFSGDCDASHSQVAAFSIATGFAIGLGVTFTATGGSDRRGAMAAFSAIPNLAKFLRAISSCRASSFSVNMGVECGAHSFAGFFSTRSVRISSLSGPCRKRVTIHAGGFFIPIPAFAFARSSSTSCRVNPSASGRPSGRVVARAVWSMPHPPFPHGSVRKSAAAASPWLLSASLSSSVFFWVAHCARS